MKHVRPTVGSEVEFRAQALVKQNHAVLLQELGAL
jgi:hypothetical protein